MKPNSILILRDIQQKVESDFYFSTSDNKEQHENGKKYLLDDIMKIFYCEAAEAKKVGRFDIWNYVSEDDQRPICCGVHYEPGLAVASDTHQMVIVADTHNTEWDGLSCRLEDGTVEYRGTTRHKDGTLIDGVYPKWRRVLPKVDKEAYEIDADLLDRAEKALKAERKSGSKLSKAHIYIQCGQHENGKPRIIAFDLRFLRKAQVFCKAFNYPFAFHLSEGGNVRQAVRFGSIDTEVGTLILMPIAGPSESGQEGFVLV